MSKKFIEGTELVQAGFANGISTQLGIKQALYGPEATLTEEEKQQIIFNASAAFGKSAWGNVGSFAGSPVKGFAKGGNINGPSIVGENGPELFIPNGSGTIIPNNRMSQSMQSEPSITYNGPYIQYMSAIDTQSATQFLSKNKAAVWSANQSANRSVPVNR